MRLAGSMALNRMNSAREPLTLLTEGAWLHQKITVIQGFTAVSPFRAGGERGYCCPACNRSELPNVKSLDHSWRAAAVLLCYELAEAVGRD
jgi:hypothetical protein